MGMATLTKWGNSFGLRVPKDVCKKAHVYVGEQFEVDVKSKNRLVFTPIDKPRDGWLEAFNLSADVDSMDKDFGKIENDFDKDEWTW
ncbi:MAG: hypothetical protein KAS93_03470 [Gammaproteobacteria bacterium]|nr:hypothetical protein [Gammaproteobacteria bacterium]